MENKPYLDYKMAQKFLRNSYFKWNLVKNNYMVLLLHLMVLYNFHSVQYLIFYCARQFWRFAIKTTLWRKQHLLLCCNIHSYKISRQNQYIIWLLVSKIDGYKIYLFVLCKLIKRNANKSCFNVYHCILEYLSIALNLHF